MVGMEGKFSKEIVLENIVSANKKIDEAARIGGRNGKDVTLLAATKTVDAETINFAIDNGINCIGENRVQELLEKYAEASGERNDDGGDKSDKGGKGGKKKFFGK